MWIFPLDLWPPGEGVARPEHCVKDPTRVVPLGVKKWRAGGAKLSVLMKVGWVHDVHDVHDVRDLVWPCMILYNLIWIIDLYVWKSAQFRTNYCISFMFWLQISSIVLMFGMIVGMPGFWTQPWLKFWRVSWWHHLQHRGKLDPDVAWRVITMPWSILNVSSWRANPRIWAEPKPHRWDLLLPTECQPAGVFRLDMAHRCTEFQKVASVACIFGAFHGIWTFFSQGGQCNVGNVVWRFDIVCNSWLRLWLG